MRKRHITTLVVAVTGLALVAGTLMGCTDAGSSKTDLTDEQIKAYTEIATFKDGLFDCEVDEALGGLTPTYAYASSDYGPGSTADPKRTVVDGPSIPLVLVGPTVPDYTNDLGQHFCTSPEAALSFGYMFGNLKVPGTETRVFDLEGNAALALADIKVKEINNVTRTLVFKDGDDFGAFAERNKVFKEYMTALVSILYQMQPVGIQSLLSTWNLHTTAAEAGIPNMLVNDVEEDLEALVFAWVLKGKCVPAELFGANIHDVRPEKFKPADYEQFCTPPTTPPGEVVDCVEPCDWTPPVGCPDCKNPANDVQAPQGTTVLGVDELELVLEVLTPADGNVIDAAPHEDVNPTAVPPVVAQDPVIAAPPAAPSDTTIVDPG